MKSLNLLVLMYHYVRDANDAAESGSGIPGMPVSHFESQIDDLAGQFEMVSWLDVKKHLLGIESLPPTACLLTFDDGVCDHYINVYPALRKRGLSGLFFALSRVPGSGLALGHKIHFLLARLGLERLRESFLERLDAVQMAAFRQAEAKYQADLSYEAGPDKIEVFKLVLQRDLSDIAERILSQLIASHLGSEVDISNRFYLSPAQISEMAANGMHFGGHSQSHPWFDWVSAERQAQEIESSAAWLSTFEARPWGFAYPYGGLDSQSASLLHASGFVGAFTTVRQVVHTDPFLIGRFDAEAFIPEMAKPDFSAGGT
jgi:peptidoglycan/xylan/chitin deacetylase (PgdA/CDA1 family)